MIIIWLSGGKNNYASGLKHLLSLDGTPVQPYLNGKRSLTLINLNSIMNSRRQFLKIAGTGLLAAGLAPVSAFTNVSSASAKKTETFSVGMAGYTFQGVFSR